MQIDFHHTVIYILSRLAGFSTEEASTISYSSQFVDDAVHDHNIWFDNGASYKPICSAHKVVDYRNFDALANFLSWVPFHFLPGNCMIPAGEYNDKDFVSRIICRPNSYIARDMINECINRRDMTNALHRLGIALHVYADTWAHQGFAGINSNVNRVDYTDESDVGKNLIDKVAKYFTHIFNKDAGQFIGKVEPLGHGPVLCYPDLPYLKWSYKDYQGEEVSRDNTAIFLDAVKNIYHILACYKKGNLTGTGEQLDLNYVNKFAALFSTIKDEDSTNRHQKWIECIVNNEFGFGSEYINYQCEGDGSWEHIAFGGDKPIPCTCLKFSEEFMESDWKKFNDALRDHQYFLHRVLFPKYNMCIT